MAINKKFPGVYPSITDLTGVVANNSATACGYVGEAEFGPVFKPTLLSSLADYTNKFGTLSSKYGYAGYSLAVAAETIAEHYFVRVVPDNAKWATAGFSLEGKINTLNPAGYTYEEISGAEEARDSENEVGLFEEDVNCAFIAAATNPNTRNFFVSIEDSTINENRAVAMTVSNTSYASKVVTITLDANDASIFEQYQDAKESDYIVVTGFSTDDATLASMNGKFALDSATKDDGTQELTLKYTLATDVGDEVFTEDNLTRVKVKLYPPANQTSFSLTVSEKVGRVYQTLESYPYCTLYTAQDEYGNSTFLEDVINGTSPYIQVFVNKNPVQQDEELVMIPAEVSLVRLVGGTNGNWTTSTISKNTALSNGWELFRDRSQTNVSLLLNSGYTDVSYQNKMLEIAEARRDCFCLFDIPMTETSYEKAIDWRKNTLGMNTYRAALSSPWVKTYDAVQGRANFIMCPSAYIAKIMGASNPWIAPAGLNRGILGASTVAPTGLTQYYDDVQGGNLYTDNQINCIIKNAGAGYANWGQRTLQQKPSALDRINVARTVIYIETVLRDAAKWHLFENNTAYLRTQITLQFNSFLDTILTADGIAGYRVVCNETNNTAQVIQNNQLKIDIYLKPQYTAEVILLSSIITNDTSETVVTTI